jgi:hypothetical protein
MSIEKTDRAGAPVRFLAATGNEHKIREFREIFSVALGRAFLEARGAGRVKQLL